MVQSEKGGRLLHLEEGCGPAHRRQDDSVQPRLPGWRRAQVAVLFTLATGLLVAAGAVDRRSALGGATALEGPGLHVVHLPDGKIEMEYTRAARMPDFGASDYAPRSKAFEEGYAYAREAAPQNIRPDLGPVQQRARFVRIMPGPQPEPMGAFAPKQAVVVGGGSDINALQGQLSAIGSAQQAAMIQEEQQEQAIQAAESAVLTAPAPFRAARQRAALASDPALVQNALMREAAAAMEAQEGPSAPVAVRALASARGKVVALKSKSAAAARVQLRAAREQSLAEEDSAPSADAAQASEQAAEEAQQVEEVAPAPAAAEPAEEGFAGPAAGPACGGATGVACALPTSNTGLQALQARLSADETAIFTLTKDVQVPPPPSRTNWTRLVPPSVLTGHVSPRR